jgi:hypothetical protein
MKVEAYLQNPDMWEATFVLHRCLFPMIRVLRLGDKSACGGMSQIVYLVHQMDEAIKNSMELLRDLKYFRMSHPREANDVDGLDGGGDDDGMESDDAAMLDPEEDSDAEAVEENLVIRQHLGEQILDFWNIRRQKLITILSVAAWFCSPEAEIQKDVLENGTGQDRQAIDGVITKIFYPIQWEDLALKIQAFWKEFDDFQSKTGEIYNGLSDPFLSIWHLIGGTRFGHSHTPWYLDMLPVE